MSRFYPLLDRAIEHIRCHDTSKHHQAPRMVMNRSKRKIMDTPFLTRKMAEKHILRYLLCETVWESLIPRGVKR